MSSGAKTAYTGELVVDVTPLKDHLIDYGPQGLVGLKHEKPGIDDVMRELDQAKNGALAALGIALDVVTRIETRTTVLKEVRSKKALAQKLFEVLAESEADLENAREGDIALIARSAQTATQHIDGGTAANFEQTLKYYSQIADKAAATRKKNAAGGEEEKG